MAKVLSILLTAGAIMSGLAHAEPVLFGQLRADYGVVDGNEDRRYRIDEHGSRFGIRGASFIDHHNEFTYILEGESDLVDEDELLHKVRQAWVGVRGKGAEVRLGRHLSPTRVSVTPVDMFVNQGADQRKILESDTVMSKSLVYLSRFNEFAYAAAVSLDSDNQSSATDFLINYNNEKAYIVAAYLKGYDQQRVSRLAATYLFPAGHKLGLAFEYLDDKGAGDDHKAYVVSAGYKLDEQKLLKLQYGANKSSAGGQTETLFGVGVDYNMSENTAFQFQFSTNRHLDHADKNERIITVGVVYDF